MGSPVPTMLICLAYLYFVKMWGPKMMEKRSPFVLREIMIFYNTFQIVFNGWMFYELGRYGWLSGK